MKIQGAMGRIENFNSLLLTFEIQNKDGFNRRFKRTY
jgi:hypothetical protein